MNIRKGKREVIVPDPERLRDIRRAHFGWIDARIQRDGWLERLPVEAWAVYAFLCLAADPQGVSFYRRDRISLVLGIDDVLLQRALGRLVELGLVGYRPFDDKASDGFHQVLAVPAAGPTAGLLG